VKPWRGVITDAETPDGLGEVSARAEDAAETSPLVNFLAFLCMALGLPNPPQADGASSAERFTGRYLYGPEEAPIRIVIFAGYQCQDCYTIEQQLVSLMQTRSDINVSMKHFPFCKDCNPYMSRTMHANGCWAARAAEAAGILWGKDGFWKMHQHLFSKRGSFQSVVELTSLPADENVWCFA
jgi:hypothetical protein